MTSLLKKKKKLKLAVLEPLSAEQGMRRDPTAMVSLPVWEEGNYCAAKLGVEEGIGIFLLEKLTQVILVLLLFYVKNHLEVWDYIQNFIFTRSSAVY